jgi:mannonate dehydratase
MILMDQLPWNAVTSSNLNFYRALGVEALLVHIPAEMADGRDPTDEFVRLRDFVAEHGLKLEVLHSHMVPRDKIIHGLPGRDEQIENWGKVIRAIGNAGLDKTATTFYAIGHFRSESTLGRGGARYSTFSVEALEADPDKFRDKAISEERLWENMAYFVNRIVPIAEEAGVRIALHPDDPPVPDPLGGAARIIVSIPNYQRIFDMASSDAMGMLFCQGCVSEMGTDVLQAIRTVGEQGKIVFVHFRNIRGMPHDFQEVFIDEGDVDMVEAMRVYREIGYDGPVMLDHTPGIQDDEGARAGHAFANGYIRALIQAVYR